MPPLVPSVHSRIVGPPIRFKLSTSAPNVVSMNHRIKSALATGFSTFYLLQDRERNLKNKHQPSMLDHQLEIDALSCSATLMANGKHLASSLTKDLRTIHGV